MVFVDEIKNPLAAILGYTETILHEMEEKGFHEMDKEKIIEKTRDTCQKIREQGYRIKNMVGILEDQWEKAEGLFKQLARNRELPKAADVFRIKKMIREKTGRKTGRPRDE